MKTSEILKNVYAAKLIVAGCILLSLNLLMLEFLSNIFYSQ
jgi:hypothetical protein